MIKINHRYADVLIFTERSPKGQGFRSFESVPKVKFLSDLETLRQTITFIINMLQKICHKDSKTQSFTKFFWSVSNYNNEDNSKGSNVCLNGEMV